MKLRSVIVTALVIALAASSLAPAAAGKKKSKGPKPYKSPEGTIAVAHTMLYSSTGEPQSVTAKEFQNRCAVPASNGFDAYVYEVPKEYQTIQANIAARGTSNVGHDLYAFFYDDKCVLKSAVSAQAAVAEKIDAEGIMPAGTFWVVLASFAGDPVKVFYELKP